MVANHQGRQYQRRMRGRSDRADQGSEYRGDGMAGEPTQVLADFAAALTYESIPERVRESCKDLLLDALACAVAGHQGEETHQLAALAAGLAQSRESTVIAGDRSSLA